MTPGAHLRAEIQRLGLDQGIVASATEVSRQTINNIVNDRAPISRSMAAKLGRVTGQSSDYWLRSSFSDKPTSNGQPHVDTPPDGGRRFVNPVLVNHQIIAAVNDGVIGIDPLVANNVQYASIHLTLDDCVITSDGERIDIASLPDRRFPLQCQQTVNVRTKEWIELPLDYVGRLGAMTQVAKYGIMTSHGLQVDPGFKGYLQFCLFNAGEGTFFLCSGAPIISLEIVPLTTPASTDRTPSRPFNSVDERDDVAAYFQTAALTRMSRRLVCAFIARQVTIGSHAGQVLARIALLDIEHAAHTEQGAIRSVIEAALDGLRTLRSNPELRTPQHEQYDVFVRELAEQSLLTKEECLGALAMLGLAAQGHDSAIVMLRDGNRALLHLPQRNARITLKNLAHQLQLRPDDLLLILTGSDAGRALTEIDKKNTTKS